MTIHQRAEIAEAGLLIRWAAAELGPTERAAIRALSMIADRFAIHNAPRVKPNWRPTSASGMSIEASGVPRIRFQSEVTKMAKIKFVHCEVEGDDNAVVAVLGNIAQTLLGGRPTPELGRTEPGHTPVAELAPPASSLSAPPVTPVPEPTAHRGKKAKAESAPRRVTVADYALDALRQGTPLSKGDLLSAITKAGGKATEGTLYGVMRGLQNAGKVAYDYDKGLYSKAR